MIAVAADVPLGSLTYHFTGLDDAGADPDDWAVAFELFLAALRDPDLRSVTQRWMDLSRTTLERFVDAPTARGVDALIEGLVIHMMLSTERLQRDAVRRVVQHFSEPAG